MASKRQQQAFEVRLGRIKALKIAVAAPSGGFLRLGTPDYERRMSILAEHLSDEELASMERLHAKGS